jgi:hypothetical protein
MSALEHGRIDIARAQYLAPLQDDARLAELFEQAPALSMSEFARLAQSVVVNNTSYTVDDGRLADIDRKLAKIRTITSVGLAHLDRILARVLELRSQAQVDAGISGSASRSDGETEDPQTADRPARPVAQGCRPVAGCETS